jgi:hypothetical protein
MRSSRRCHILPRTQVKVVKLFPGERDRQNDGMIGMDDNWTGGWCRGGRGGSLCYSLDHDVPEHLLHFNHTVPHRNSGDFRLIPLEVPVCMCTDDALPDRA